MKIEISTESIQNKVRELADLISEDYRGKELLLCGILNGAFVFLADLSRSLSLPHRIDFMGASSYGDGTVSSGTVKITKYPESNPSGKHILIVEDIIETGATLHTMANYLKEEGALSVKVCSLVVKNKSGVSYHADYVGFAMGDEFLVGYGMDYAGLYRNLPYIATLDSGDAPN